MRFHPQNNYVGVPNVDIALPGREAARIGVLKDPILALPTQKPAIACRCSAPWWKACSMPPRSATAPTSS